jgi:uncharacterized protein YjiS (DUF1127 family)
MELTQRGSAKNSPTRQAATIAAIKRLSAIVLGTFVGLARRLRSLLAAWRQHAEEQRYLSDLNDYYLKDIGLSRSEATRDEAAPFWRP